MCFGSHICFSAISVSKSAVLDILICSLHLCLLMTDAFLLYLTFTWCVVLVPSGCRKERPFQKRSVGNKMNMWLWMVVVVVPLWMLTFLLFITDTSDKAHIGRNALRKKHLREFTEDTIWRDR